MQKRTQHTLAALVITASLAMPGAALAAVPATPPPSAESAAPTAKPPVDETGFKISREQAITIARSMFAIPEALGEPNVNIEQFDDGAMWRIQFESADARKGFGGLSVGVDAETGSVLNYNRLPGNPAQQPATVRYTRAEAAEKAQYWLDMLAPALRPSMRAMDRPSATYFYGPGMQGYEFAWERMAEGYPTRDDGVHISIDPGTGELQSFQRSRWQKRTYQLPASILPKEKAEAIYRQLPMQLTYQYFQTPATGVGEWRLVYRPITGEVPVLGQEGQLLNMMGRMVDLTSLQSSIKLVPAPDQPYKAPDKPLNRDQALALARTLTGQVGEPADANYYESGGGQQLHIWSFNWQSDGKEGPGISVGVEVDVDRGVIRGYNSWSQETAPGNAPSQMSEADAREAAIRFIRTTRPDLAGNLVVMPGDDLNSPYYVKDSGAMARLEHSVRFMLTKNGIPIDGRQVEVMVDGATGKVRNVWANEYSPDDRFPSAQALITPADAMTSYLNQPGLELAWSQFWTVPTNNAQPQQQPPQLVWGSVNPYMTSGIDARSGALLDYRGRDLADAAKRPTDIAGHFAEREIELLWTRGVLEMQEGKFNPNQAATVGDVARWLVMARGMNPYTKYDFRRFGDERMAKVMAATPTAPYLGAALEAGIILPEELGAEMKPDADVSRELLALWTARALGYSAVAKMPDRIAMPFADQKLVGAKYANAVALLHGLGIIKGDEATSFAPQRAATRGEAVKFVFAVASAEFQR
jgi:hypothetical protein